MHSMYGSYVVSKKYWTGGTDSTTDVVIDGWSTTFADAFAGESCGFISGSRKPRTVELHPHTIKEWAQLIFAISRRIRESRQKTERREREKHGSEIVEMTEVWPRWQRPPPVTVVFVFFQDVVSSRELSGNTYRQKQKDNHAMH